MTVAVPSDKATESWGMVRAILPKTLNLLNHRGLAVWINGDGSGAYLHFVLHSINFTEVRDYYTHIDFRGWRLITMKNPTEKEISQFHFPYPSYRALQDFDYRSVDTISIFLTNIPPKSNVVVSFAQPQALLEHSPSSQTPTFILNGRMIEFSSPLPLKTHLEITPAGKAFLHDANEHTLGANPVNNLAPLPHGPNRIEQQNCDDDTSIQVSLRGPSIAQWIVN
jgi:hypothetical protein